MFSKKDFQEWGKQNVVLFAAVMTKIEGRKDDDLLRTYEFRGFPSMALLDAEGSAITKQIPRDLFSMKNIVAAAPDYVKLAADVKAGKEVDERKWFMARLGMGQFTADEAKAQFANASLTGESKAEAEQILFVLEMNDLSRKARGRGATEEDKMAACVAVYDAFKAGKRLPAGASPEPFVDEMLIDAAKSNGDADAFFFAYERVRARHLERIEQLEDYLPRYRADLEKHKDDEQTLARIKGSLTRLEGMITEIRKQVADLEAMAKKLKAG